MALFDTTMSHFKTKTHTLLSNKDYFCLNPNLIGQQLYTITLLDGMKKAHIITLLHLFILTLLPINLIGNNIRQITNLDGLSNSAILSILQDKDGYVWFGSCDGLNLYNGFEVTTFSPTNGNLNLSGNLIEGLIESDDNVLWIHTNYGLNKFDKKNSSLSVYPQFKGLYFIGKDHQNIIYIIMDDNRIFYYNKNKDTFESFGTPGIDYSDLIDFTISSDDNIHLFTHSEGEKIFYIDRRNDQFSFIEKKNESKSKNLYSYCFHEISNPNVVYFIDKKNILFEYDLLKNQKSYIFDLTDEIKTKGTISSLIKFHDNYFIGYKNSGVALLKYNSSIAEKYKIEDTAINASIFTLVKDRYQDLIWVGTDGSGVYMYSEDLYTIRSYTYPDLLLNITKPIRALYKDADNSLWIGTKGDGIVKLNNFSYNNFSKDKPFYFNTSNSDLAGNSIYSFEKSNHDILWIGTEDGLSYYSFNEHKIKNISIKNNEKSEIKFIHGICELNDSTLWLATVGDGIIKTRISWQGNTPMLIVKDHLTLKDSRTESNYFFTIFNDTQDSKIWFGNRGYGAYYLQYGSPDLFNLSFENLDSIQSINDINAIGKDKLDNMWFGTSMGLIQQTKENKLSLFTQKDGLLNATIHSILPEENALWLSTNKGISRFDIELNTFYNYDKGLSVIEFSDGANFIDSKSNELYFGGINGFVSIKRELFTGKEYNPIIHFDKLEIYGNKVNLSNYLEDKKGKKTLTLNFNQNFFSISFIALNYINGSDYDYYYQLEGLSNKWINNHSSNSVAFTSLAPGKYTLLTKYINKLTGEESLTYTLKIQILPPWYMSWWAYLSYSFLAILIISFVIRLRYIQNQRRKNDEMKKIKQKHNEEVYESKLDFFTSLANEFTTPLTLIYGPCSHILSDPEINQDLKQNALLIQKNTERMNTLIQDLVEFRKVEKGHLDPILERLNIGNFIYYIGESYSGLAQSKDIQIDYNIEKNIEWNTDQNFLYTIISNLITNAFFYTNEQGKIDIIAYEKLDHLCLIVSYKNNDLEINAVNDFFDENVIIDSLENPTETSKYSKNSIGLLTSYNMAKLLGGKIEIESSINEHISFVVTLPKQDVSEDTPYILTSEIVKEKNYLLKDEKITKLPNYTIDNSKLFLMIIAEDIEMLWFLCEIFKNEYNVIPINNSLEVNTSFDKNLPDLIIYDIIAQDTKEATLIKSIKSNKKTAHIPFILISSKHSSKDKTEGIRSGIQVFVSKPFDSEYIKASVKNLLSGKEVLKDYFDSPLSAFVLKEGQLSHKEDSKFINEIQEIISSNTSNPNLSVQIIAENLNISVRHLYRRMKEIGVDSLSDMIKQSRLHIARKYLLNSQMTINEIIYKTGFTNRATFFRLFTQKYNCTPKQYREKNLKDGSDSL